MMRALLTAAALVLTGDAFAQERPRTAEKLTFEQWKVNYLRYEPSGNSACSLNLTWPTGLWLNLHSFGGSGLNFNIIGRGWAASDKLSEVIFELDGGYGRIFMFAGGGDSLFFGVKDDPELMSELLDGLAKSSALGLRFPNGDRYQGTIAGADKAVAEFRRCLAEWAGKKGAALPRR